MKVRVLARLKPMRVKSTLRSFFLMASAGKTSPLENGEIAARCWVPLDQAMHLLDYKADRKALKAARRSLPDGR